jgi:hypothetical protein
MVVEKLRDFGRKIFGLYDKYPLLMNCVAGGSVYVTSEVIVQLQSQFESKQSVDWKRVGQIGLLGSMENGIFMSAWL